jgi:hypothetical protein
MLNFYMYQSGIDFKSPYSNRPFKPLIPSIGLGAVHPFQLYKGPIETPIELI